MVDRDDGALSRRLLHVVCGTITRLAACIQIHDIDLDQPGLACIGDSAGTGLHGIEYLG